MGTFPYSWTLSFLRSGHCHAASASNRYGVLNLWNPPEWGYWQNCFSNADGWSTGFPNSLPQNWTLCQELQCMPFRNKYASPRTNLSTLMNLDTNISRRNRLLCKRVLNTEIGVAPAYQTRTQDDIHIAPTMRTFHNAYQLLHLPFLTSKTWEKAFKVLNRTVWTHNKAYKSHMRADPNCENVEKLKQWNIYCTMRMHAILATYLDLPKYVLHNILTQLLKIIYQERNQFT